MYGASVGDMSALTESLAKGVPIDEVDDNGDTALIHAARSNQLEAVNVLLSMGADPIKRSNTGITASEIGKQKSPEMSVAFEGATNAILTDSIGDQTVGRVAKFDWSCPGCSRPLAQNDTKCMKCAADFTSAGGWKPIPSRR